jgi:hypothetical protein
MIEPSRRAGHSVNAAAVKNASVLQTGLVGGQVSGKMRVLSRPVIVDFARVSTRSRVPLTVSRLSVWAAM